MGSKLYFDNFSNGNGNYIVSGLKVAKSLKELVQIQNLVGHF